MVEKHPMKEVVRLFVVPLTTERSRFPQAPNQGKSTSPGVALIRALGYSSCQLPCSQVR